MMIKRIAPIFLALSFCVQTLCQDTSRVETKTFVAPSIDGNKGGEDPARRLTIYLPPGYAQSKQRYPVIYFLHGFAADDQDMVSAPAAAQSGRHAAQCGRIKLPEFFS